MSEQDRVLVVEDEETLAESVVFHLEREGYVATSIDNGGAALAAAQEFGPDLVVLDLMLPGLSGLDVLRQLRIESDVPVLIVTAKDSEADRVSGLELGADDYITKPFSMRELVARVRANMRRSTGWTRTADELEVIGGGRIMLDMGRHEVRVDGELIEVRPREFDLLEHLMLRSGRLVTREQLLDEVWGAPFYGDPKTLDVHIRRLRSKIERNPRSPEHITTVRGLGYKFNDGK